MKLYSPMLAKPSSLDFLRQVEDDSNWAAVEKFDGYRQLLYLSNQGNHLYSRYGNDHIANCPQFQTIVPKLDGTVLDCEGLTPTRRLEDNAACFKAHSENAIAWQKANGNAFLVAFDVLQWGDIIVLDERQELRSDWSSDIVLELQFKGMPIKAEELVLGGKKAYYDSLVANGGEGVILKDLRAPYTPGKRTSAWLKVKRLEHCEYFIRGFLPAAEGKFEGLIGSVVYGSYKEDVGTASGMDDETRLDMTRFPNKYIWKKALFECQRLTDRGCMRHPRWKGLII